MTALSYVGSELELFSKATNWKAYYAGILKQYLAGDVLEVGAGIGSTTEALCDGSQDRWVCLEPDVEMGSLLKKRIEEGRLPRCCEAVTGVITKLDPDEAFDAIIYIDVLEHIEADREEMEAAAVGRIAGMHGVSFLSIKDISNNEYLRESDIAEYTDFPVAEVGKRAAALLAQTITKL